MFFSLEKLLLKWSPDYSCYWNTSNYNFESDSHPITTHTMKELIFYLILKVLDLNNFCLLTWHLTGSCMIFILLPDTWQVLVWFLSYYQTLDRFIYNFLFYYLTLDRFMYNFCLITWHLTGSCTGSEHPKLKIQARRWYHKIAFWITHNVNNVTKSYN